MKKVLLRYVIFWLPAVLVAYLYSNGSTVSQVLQWGFAVLMVVAWGVNTGVGAYLYPKTMMAVLLLYTGVSVLLITALYAASYGTALYSVLSRWGGILSFKPLGVIVEAIRDFAIPHEIYVTGALVLLCLLGYAIGILYRRVHPNPYRPRVLRKY